MSWFQSLRENSRARREAAEAADRLAAESLELRRRRDEVLARGSTSEVLAYADQLSRLAASMNALAHQVRVVGRPEHIAVELEETSDEVAALATRIRDGER